MFRYQRTAIAFKCDTKLTITPSVFYLPFSAVSFAVEFPTLNNFIIAVCLHRFLNRAWGEITLYCIGVKLFFMTPYTLVYIQAHSVIFEETTPRHRFPAALRSLGGARTSQLQRNSQIHTWSEWWASFSIFVYNTSDIPRNPGECFTFAPSLAQSLPCIFKGKNDDSTNSLFSTFTRVPLAR